MKPGEDAKDVSKDIENKQLWAVMDEVGSDGKPSGAELARFCTLCAGRLRHGSSGKNVFSLHESDLGLKAAV